MLGSAALGGAIFHRAVMWWLAWTYFAHQMSTCSYGSTAIPFFWYVPTGMLRYICTRGTFHGAALTDAMSSFCRPPCNGSRGVLAHVLVVVPLLGRYNRMVWLLSALVYLCQIRELPHLWG
jgi:hypothetical protein